MEPWWLSEDNDEASGWTAGISIPVEGTIFPFPLPVFIPAVRTCKPLPDEHQSYISFSSSSSDRSHPDVFTGIIKITKIPSNTTSLFL